MALCTSTSDVGVRMKLGVPWSVSEIRPDLRESAQEAARRSGMSLADWLNSVIISQAAGTIAPAENAFDPGPGEFTSVHQRLDELTRRIEQLNRTGPAAYAPKHHNTERTVQAPPLAPRMPPALDRAIAEIAARQRALGAEPAKARQQPPKPATPRAAAIPPAPVFAPVPAQDLSGLEDQLRKITNQIETLRRPGVEDAINALRGELAEIGKALNDAMPRNAIETLEQQIARLDARIAEGRQSGADGAQLAGVEQGLAEVRDALRALTPAENLVGFQEAVADLARKIDLIVAQKDPATLAQLDRAITTLRDMAAHVASNDAVGSLSNQVHALAEKVDRIALSNGASEALNSLEHRIDALSTALSARAQSGASVPPMLESLVKSLSDKIELIQQSRGDSVAVEHLEDRIVSLVERLDASDSRLGHLEAIERGLADLLVHIEDLRADKESGALRANSAGVDTLKQDIARTQQALDAVNGTLGHVVDRLITMEKEFRGGVRANDAADADRIPPQQAFGKVAVRVVTEPPAQAAAAAKPSAVAPQAAPMKAAAPPIATPTIAAPAKVAPPMATPTVQVKAPPPVQKRLPPAATLPINADLPPDQPLEPGSGPPQFRRSAGARISAAADDFEDAAAATGGKLNFIAAARRAAKTAIESTTARPPSAEAFESDDGNTEAPTLRDRLMKRVKTLFIAASIIAIVIGTIQIASNFINFSGSKTVTLTPEPSTEPADAANDIAGPAAPPASVVPNQVRDTTQPAGVPLSPLLGDMISVGLPGSALSSDPTPAQNPPSLLSPPVLGPAAPETKNDITGSIARPGARPAALTPPPAIADADRLPLAIGSTRLRSAAVAGDGAAAYEVALRFADGRGVPADPQEAAHWFERAANKGIVPAQFRYASLLEKGLGVKKDLAGARRLYLAAAAKGNAKAMHNLAVLYAEGIDGKPDYSTAVQWFRKAAQHGVADSQYNLGVLIARGLGTEANYGESYKWFALAAAQGDREAAKKRDEIVNHLDENEQDLAKQAVKAFVPEREAAEASSVAQPPGGWDQVSTPVSRVRPRSPGPLSLGAL
jgi:localization factor PodJL